LAGTYTLFQETYHRATFKKMHPYGPKSDYDHRLLTMDRAQIGGLDDVGIGALFGLHDYRFEVMALLMVRRLSGACRGACLLVGGGD
jgi:2-iminoacetate synthase